MEPGDKKEFVIEKMKEHPINKKKLLRRTAITAFMAVMFGLIACFTFLVLEPIISNWLYPKEKPKQQAEIFPEEREEMEPEEMLSEHMFANGLLNSEIQDDNKESMKEEREQELLDLLDEYSQDVNSYMKMYDTLGSLAQDLQTYIVTVTGSKSDTDWLENSSDKKTEASGVVIGNNGTELLILTNCGNLKNADSLSVTFWNNFNIQAKLLQKHTPSDIAIVCVNIAEMGEKINDVRIAPLGSSYVDSHWGTPVIALGTPTGMPESVGYGIITSENGEVNMVDANFEVLVTDIYGSTNGTGFLFNLKGQIIGVITDKKPSSDVRYMITAFEIGDLRRLISKLSNNIRIPYVGVTGTTVSEQVHQESNVPLGVFVKSVDMNSPAMKAGLQAGDVIIEINNKEIKEFKDYFNTIAGLDAGATATFKVMRLSVNEYKQMSINIIVKEAK